MEELQARHRKEQRDLQSRITQKKKQASKKTRKGVNDECDRLETELKERQQREVAELNGEAQEEDVPEEQLEDLNLKTDDEDQPKAPDPPEETEHNDTEEQNQPAKKRNRQKDRLARRQAEQEALIAQAKEEAANAPDLKQQERDRMLEAMKSHNLTEKEIRADGHCLYSAVADQLSQLDIPIGSTPNLAYKSVRQKAASYIEAHQDDFVPFLEEPLPDYLHKIRDTGEWGGQLELMALAKTFGTDINVLQDFGRVEKIEGGDGSEGEKKEMWLGYYKHGFGLGEHYNSLRRKVP